MNLERRTRIDALRVRLSAIHDELEELQLQEQDAFENTPESLATAQRALRSQEAAYQLLEAVDSIGEALAQMEAATE